MANPSTRIVEIDGIKMEVDLRQAKRIDTFKVGDSVKLLRTQYSSTRIHQGVIVAFENFASLPTIVVAYVEASYSSAEVKLAYVNAKSQAGDDKVELIANNDKAIDFDRADIITKMYRQIDTKVEEIADIFRKMRYFNAQFGQMFGESAEAVAHRNKLAREEEEARLKAIQEEKETLVSK